MEVLNRICNAIVQATVFVMMLLIVADATGRLLNYPVAGAVEFNEEYLMVIIVFLGLGPAYRAGRHISVEVVERLIPPAAQRWLKVGTGAAALAYFGLMAYYGWLQTAHALRIGLRSNAELAYPLAPAQSLVVIGTALLCWWLVKDIADALRRSSGHG